METWVAEHALAVVVAINVLAVAATVLAIVNVVAFYKNKEAEEMGEGEDGGGEPGA